MVVLGVIVIVDGERAGCAFYFNKVVIGKGNELV